MMITLIRKEILNNLLNYRFIMAYFLCTVLLIGSAVIMISDYMAQRKVQYVNDSVSYHEVSTLPNYDNWYTVIHRTISREPLLTGIFALGAEKDPDGQATMTRYFSPDFSGDLHRNPMVNLFPTIDLTFIIGIILSLLIFVLSFDTISGEREGGTLKVLLGGPVSRAAVIGAKWIGTYVTIMLPCVTAWVAISLILAFNSSMTVTAQDWLRILGIFLVSSLFIACIVSLAIMVSTLLRYGTSVLLALLAGWVIFVVGIPSLSGPLAAHIKHIPPAQELESIIHRYGFQIEKTGIAENPAMTNVFERELAGRNYDSLPREERDRIYRMNGEAGQYWDLVYLDKTKELITTELNKRSQAENLAQWISRISPYGCFQDACVTLAGTGITREEELTRSVVAYNRAVVEFAYSDQSKCPECDTRGYGPVMHITRTPVATAALRALPDIGILALMTVLFFMVSFVGFMRSEID